MGIVPHLPARIIIRKLERAGFKVIHQRGSHAKLYHTDSKRKVTIPIHPGDISSQFISRILKQAGISIEDFLDL